MACFQFPALGPCALFWSDDRAVQDNGIHAAFSLQHLKTKAPSVKEALRSQTTLYQIWSSSLDDLLAFDYFRILMAAISQRLPFLLFAC